jgi:F-type H+-transporting ATPase subunit epsilon
MSDNIIKFEIVTPERVVLHEDIKQITVPTKDGEITILPLHIPLIASLKPGVLDVRRADGETELISISGGFVEVLKNKVVVLADTAERAHEIDLARAEEAHRRAEALMKKEKQLDQKEFASINAMIEKELARTKAAKRWRRIKNIINDIKLKKE